MKFQKGHKFAKGGKRDGAGRPTKEEAEEKRIQAETALAVLQARGVDLANKYVTRALEAKADKVLCHAIEG